jgi:hypothetical protein
MVEEAGYHACEKVSLGERFCWGSEFSWRESNRRYKALRIPSHRLVLKELGISGSLEEILPIDW